MVESVRAWRPAVPLVREVLHAEHLEHAYPAHTHDSWTLLTVDDGAVVYELDGRRHHVMPGTLTVLPPGVPHTGRTATGGERYRKRVLYLEPEWLPAGTIGGAVHHPAFTDGTLAAGVASIHAALAQAAPTTAALAVEFGVLRLGARFRDAFGADATDRDDPVLARRFRAMLDEHLTEQLTIADAAAALHVHPAHLARVFSAAFRIAPHQYVSARRVDLARRLLLAGRRPVDAAAEAGFADQPHMTRQFRRVLGTTPGTFAAA
ncbi:AraC family transcriptional regulator [Curtobacterium sp. MCBD17_034]|uniref:helix-turn-helix transcriptional regulator n=1 Tax=unclassified Curtobacterium TaxID=257496 RepID=UPI000DA77BBF|nr:MULTISPECIES: AraC family transcriptional regulator [unclassified Curtobacterium]PZE73416.1 AraC family transcriptional regulator [Curtobacterium sp. MCBD17_019]PZF61230.1 AraC family transcriptional regulator [Curtobacterium sp. MCBD17_034]PZM33063.1 AraC family transcriptional regulator [Curtobacterium sp. MCBD17_031]